MKKLRVTIEAEFEVPDSWELVESEHDGEVIKMDDGSHLDMTFEPMITKDLEEGTWTNSYTDEFMNGMLEMLQSESKTMTLDK